MRAVDGYGRRKGLDPRLVPPVSRGPGGEALGRLGSLRFRVLAAEEHLAKSTQGWADADTLALG